MSAASRYSTGAYRTPLSTVPIASTGTTLVDLNTVCREKLTRVSAWYWHQEDTVLLKAQGVKLSKGTELTAVPCRYRQMKNDTIIARNRLEKTQKVAEGNLPLGLRGVLSNKVFIISSCIIPHILKKIIFLLE
jgi:hypothetical protein